VTCSRPSSLGPGVALRSRAPPASPASHEAFGVRCRSSFHGTVLLDLPVVQHKPFHNLTRVAGLELWRYLVLYLLFQRRIVFAGIQEFLTCRDPNVGYF